MKEGRVWAAFVLLALIWGTSFFFIKIGLRTLQPLTLVALRLLIGAVAALVLMAQQRVAFPRGWGLWRHFMFMGVINTGLPFVFFTWSEAGPRGIDSSLASILNSLTPLFTILLAGFITRSETVTRGKLLGLGLGFSGVVLIMGRNWQGDYGGQAQMTAAILAALCYAISSIYARRYLRGVHPVALTTAQLLAATALLWLAVLGLEPLEASRITGPTLGALLWLGVLGSALAYVLYFYILSRWGATRATLVTYVLPLVGVAAGVLVLQERLDALVILGGGLILAGIWAVNWQPGLERPIQPSAGRHGS